MFCYQCEQTAGGTGCTRSGVCGKDGETADMQDILLALVKGAAVHADALAKQGTDDAEAGRFVIQALFTTITNVNFDAADIERWIRDAAALRDRLAKQCAAAGMPSALRPPLDFTPASDRAGLPAQAAALGCEAKKKRLGPAIAGLLDMIVFGLKGAAAYADHALHLGHESKELYRLFLQGLAFVAAEPTDTGAILGWCLKAGEINLKAMELLDAANTGTYGHPVPTKVRTTPVKGPAILVSGHDLKDLRDLLEATEGKGINVYTHGEMLPCHGYPGLNRYKHLAGHYGTAWQNQRKEFDAFPGPILMTTNCIQKPVDSYNSRIFTTGLVQFPGVRHVKNGQFQPVIDAALAGPGFPADAAEKSITVGFGRNAVMSVAGAVIDAVKQGKIRRFFLIGGCDGAKPGRNYYTEFAQKAPKDTVILTLACGKFRFNQLEFGDIGGIPRLLDVGQCNDAYSAVQIALALANAFNCGVNDLPLSLILSWYEQKAVAVLLTLLHLGIKNIRLGPTLPAFVAPEVLQVLVEKFAVKPIGSVDDDLQDALAGK